MEGVGRIESSGISGIRSRLDALVKLRYEYGWTSSEGAEYEELSGYEGRYLTAYAALTGGL